jgi:hypothetical protein
VRFITKTNLRLTQLDAAASHDVVLNAVVLTHTGNHLPKSRDERVGGRGSRRDRTLTVCVQKGFG